MKYALKVIWISRGRIGSMDMTIVHEANGDTLLKGSLVDQAALHGILNRIRDLGLPLISILPLDTTAGRSQAESNE